MKRTITLIRIVICSCSYGQASADTTGIKMFNLGLKFYNNGNLDSTLVEAN